jgi:hypothetical protein
VGVDCGYFVYESDDPEGSVTGRPRDRDRALIKSLLAHFPALDGRDRDPLHLVLLLRAAECRELDLLRLVKIARVKDRDGISSAYAAAGKVADEIGGAPRRRRANQKTLHGKFQKAPALYRRLALAPEAHPAEAATRELRFSLGLEYPDWPDFPSRRGTQPLRE